MANAHFEGARERGRRAFAAGAKLDANPYRAMTRGRASYSTVFWREWRLGWREAQAESAKGDGQLNFRAAVSA